jgi:hypothetical protein
MRFLERFFSRGQIQTPIEEAIRRQCVEGGKALSALAKNPPYPTKKNLLSALTRVFSVCAGGSALEFAQMSKASGDASRALMAVGTDALLFEAAAWCLTDFSAYLRQSPQVPNDLRRPLAQALEGAVHEIGNMFGSTGAALILQRIEGALSLGNWQERGEYFGSLLLCDRDKRGIVANIPPSPVPDIRWESGVVLGVAIHFHAKVMNPQVDGSLELVRHTISALSTLPD